MRQKILIVINDIQKAQEHEWFVKFLDRELFELEFALINSRNTVMDNFLAKENIPTFHFKYHSKRDLPGLVMMLFKRMISGSYDIVHTHLFEASLAGLIASFLARVPKRIMTRHYSDYHHVWFPSAVKYDRLMNTLATDLVAISKNVVNIFVEKEKVPANKIHLIHHGLDMNEYAEDAISDTRISVLRQKYSLSLNSPVVGAISRFTELKGLQFLIPAFKRLLTDFPDAVLVLANATGDYSREIIKMLEIIPDSNKRIIEFENDIAALYKLFDCFVHIPINRTAEAFGQTYIESLASKVPAVFTLSGVAPEFAVDKKNCFIVPYCNQHAVYETLKFVFNNRNNLDRILDEGYKIITEQFDIKIKMNKLTELYKEK